MGKNANFVSHKKSKQIIDGKPKLPLATDLVEGEIAINFGKDVETLSIRNESGDVVTFSSDNYYTEQKLGSGFTGENSGVTVTEALENIEIIVDQVIDSGTSASTHAVATKAVVDKLIEDEQVWAISLNELNNKKFGYANFDSTDSTLYFYKDEDDYTSGGTAIDSVDLSDISIDIDQVIDSGTSASTDAVSTSAVYEFVTSYTPSITVDQDFSNTASTNPISTKAVYSAVTDNELVWTNAFVALSGTVSAHTENTEIHVTAADKEKINSIGTLSGTVTAHTANTEIHVTAADKEKLHTHSNKSLLDSISGAVGTMAYENTDSYSSATEVNTALSDKSDKSHEHGSNSISAMTNYQIASSASTITTSDTLNEAIGKLEKRLALLEAALKVQSNGDVYGDAEEY